MFSPGDIVLIVSATGCKEEWADGYTNLRLSKIGKIAKVSGTDKDGAYLDDGYFFYASDLQLVYAT